MSDRLADALERLTPEQRALLAKRMLLKRAPEDRTIPRRREAGPVPASFGQERLWFLEQLEPGSPAYHLTLAFWVEGALDAGALRRALRRLVRRHEALRTTFRSVEGQPVQVIDPETRLELEAEPAGAEWMEDTERQARRLVSEESRRPFDLECGPLLRARLVAFGAERHLLVLGVHHIVTDGWSQGILVRELSALYEAGLRDPAAPSSLPELPIQYPDFALWQRRRLTGEVLERQLGYWRQQLRGVPALELPADHPRPRLPSGAGGVERLHLSGDLVGPLIELDRATGTTPFMALLAAFAALLFRLTGQRDFAVGSPIAGRRRPELEGLIGLFINMLALRVDLTGAPGYRELLARTREAALAAYGRQDVPFEKLVDELSPERDPGRSPIFQVLFALQNMERHRLAFAGAEARPVTGGVATTRFDLELYAWERSGGPADGGWNLVFVYNADLFEPSTVRRLARHYGQLLRSARAEPDTPLTDLPLWTAAERHQALVEESDSARQLPAELQVHRRIARQAARTPDAVAVIGAGGQLSYRALAARSGELAADLRRLGAGPGRLVGLCVERGPEMVAALLGVLEAGAAYVPLDPGLPAERLAYMAGDAGLAALVCQRRLAAREPAVAALAGAAAGVLWLDAGGGQAGPGAAAAPEAGTAPDELAYVIYTSGSTGRPKGVQLSHRNVVNFLRSMAREPGLAAGDTVLAVTTLSFDIAVLELLLPLMLGARAVIASSAAAADGERLARLAARSRVTLMQATPATWQLLVQIDWAGDPELRMISGGEALPRRLAAELAPRGRELWNLYGPTETTVWSAAARIAGGEPEIPLGRPVDNTGLLVLDRRLRPVARGVPGQLAIAGDGLARGYLRRPALTAGVFCPHPFAGCGHRLYLTGDLVRRDGAGRLLYLGRLDHQIKLRGFRIELGEIEAALDALPAVERAVVLLHEAGASSRLVAFLLAADEGAVPAEPEIRDHLASTLPEYMVPAAFLTVAELPLTPSGKVDRKALGRIASDPGSLPAAAPASADRPPRGAVEEAVAAAFAEVLGRERVSAGDSFFRLGGHSLLATRLLFRIRERLEVELPLRAVFEAPTVAGLASKLQAAAPAVAGVPPIEPDRRDDPLPLSFGQERLWFLDQLEPGNPAYHLAGAAWIEGALDVRALHRSLRQLVVRHESLRTTFSAEGGVPAQVVAGGASPALEVERSGVAGSEARQRRARQLVGEEIGRPFDLERGPLLRARLVAFGEDCHLFVLCLHHIVTDGWSQGILMRELSALYAHYRHDPDAASPLPELPVQYPDFAVWQRRWLTGELLERQLAFWTDSLRGVPALELPADRPRPSVPSYRGGVEQLRLADAVVRPLVELDAGSTPFMALLAAFSGLLFRLTGQRDFAVGSPVANRQRPELEGLIGLFINVLALRVDLGGEPSYRQLLRRVREVALNAFSHQDLPFEKLVDELSPERQMGRSPLFQVLFALQNMERQPLSLTGVEARPLSGGVATTRFDLELYVWEHAGDWSLTFVYNADLFEASTVGRLAGHYRRLLDSARAVPEAALSALSLMSQAERHQALVESSDSERPLPPELQVHRLVARQARRTPDALAVICGDRQLTYGGLEARSRALGVRLRRAGAGPGALVGLCVERGVEMVAALLAVLEAGAAYVPLDPTLPAERLAYMAGDASLAALVSERRLAAAEPAVAALAEAVAEVVWLDAGGGAAPRAAAAAPGDAAPEALAYVIYTSGSTGRPKGVQLSHRNVVNFLRSMSREPGLASGDTVLAVTTLSFDIAVLELLLPLIVGAKTVIASSAQAADGERLARLLARSRVSLMQATPATWQLLIQLDWAGAPDLAMICGGEALPRRLAAALVPRGRELWNLYGPTETTVWSSSVRIASGEEGITLGLPIDNTGLRVLDRRLRPVPRGVAGQLAIIGTGLARGYLGRPALTAGVFCPDPVTSPGERLYLTGDLVRRDSAGRLFYLGRLDHQIKLRGFRIELGEIEAALESLPAVERAVVLLQEVGAGDQRLVAFLVSARDGAPAAEELRARLASRLPDYMVPAAFAAVGELPLTPSGKVDRKALARQASQLPAAEPEAGQEAPRGPVEEAVAAAFAEVLGRSSAGVRDHFFELGGHSLLATQLLSRVCDIFRIDLPLSTLFQHPTVAALASQIEQARRGRTAARSVAIEPVPRDRGVPREAGPLSFAQRRLWFLDQLGAGPAYNIMWTLRLDGALETGALLESLRRIVERHEPLRASFPVVDGEPRQAVSRRAALPATVVDLSALDPASRRRQLQDLGHGLGRSAFDLARGPLLRAMLVRWRERPQAASQARQRTTVLLAVHHIAFDGWSMGILGRELASHYRAIVAGQPTLPALRVQYLDFVAWQQARMEAQMERELALWKEQLVGGAGGQLPVVELPTDRPRPPVQGHRGNSRAFVLPPDTSRALAALSQQRGVTPAMLLLAGFKVLLARITGQSDLIVGSPIAQRLRSELEDLIGFFANTIVLRTDFSGPRGGLTFSECLRRVQRVSLAAYDHQEVPFDLLVDELGVERDTSRNPVFQIAFAFQHVAPAPLEFPGLELSPVPLASAVARLDLELFLFQGPSGLAGRFVYNTDLFDATTIARFSGHFRRLLESAAADPEVRIGDLELLGPAERHQLGVEWNATGQPFAAACLHDLIGAQARAAPDRVAVAFEGQAQLGGAAQACDRQLTYGELDARANRLANTLRAEGVGAGDSVALCVERGPEMIVALLGIWKAGGAYVPLDPDYPPERLAFMLGDCRARVLLTQETLLAGLPEAGIGVLCLDRDRERIASAPAGDLRPSGATPDQLAYVIYTSGSTGTPKGTLLAHRGLASLAADQARTFGTGPDSRVLQFSSLSFDASTFEIVMALTAGGTLAFGRRQELLPGPDLLAFLDRQRISIVLLPPAALAPLPPAPLPALATITTGGEACPPELPARWSPGRRFFNLYGPTEATIVSTMTELGGGKPPWIGRPVANTRAYLLDSQLRPVPVGISGELLVSGVSLARGYLERPALTAERFVPAPALGDPRCGNPLSEGPGARLYRTGDLTRRLPDGEIEFLGRIDHQVKLRGFRIELGEIEAALEAHPAVERAVVVLHEGVSHDRRLVAFLISSDGGRPAEPEIRSHLASRLPSYMVPSAYSIVAELPLTPSGKVDRKALAREAIELPAAAAPETADEATRGPAEETVAAAFCEILGRDRVDLRESFFRLGGHSLLATQLLSRLRVALDVELPLRALFEAPTVVELAARCEAARRAGQGIELPPIAPLSRDRRLPLSHAQERLWFLDRMNPGDPTLNLPSAVRLRGALQPAALELALSEVVRRHEALRTRLLEVDGRPVQEVLPAAPMRLPVIDLGSLPAARRRRELARWQARDVLEPFDLTRGTMLRARLLRLAGEDHALLLNLHHIAGDGWSMGLLWAELAAFYRALVADAVPALPELPVQYGDYAVWQRRWLGADELERQTDYWRRRLAGPPEALELPADHPRPAVQSYRGRSVRRRLGPQLSRRLRELGWERGATLFMVLLAAFKVLLYRWSGQRDVVVGTPIAGRTRAEVEGLIGLFLNSLVLRTDVGGRPSFLEVLARVREATLGAYDHQEVPFEKLLAELQPERDPSRTPLFQVFFNMLELPEVGGRSLPGLEVEALPVGDLRSKFDLTIYVSRGAEGVGLYLVYNADLFDRARMEELMGQYESLLRQVAERPEQPINRLSLATGRARQVLPEPSAALDAGWQGAVHEVFAALAEAEPARPAVIDPQGTLSYGELAALVDSLAAELIAAGVGRGGLVAIYGHRSAALVWAVLGVLRAGGGFLILDPAHPPSRQFEIMRQAAPAAWIEIADYPPPEPLGERRVRLPPRAEWPLQMGRGAVPSRTEITADDLAYVTFTSGSTGRPKGICGRHGSLSHFLPWRVETFDLGPEDRFSMLSGLAHDPLHRDLFTPLMIGAVLVVPDPEQMFQPGALASWMAEAEITVAHLTPALGQVLADPAGESVELPALRRAFLVGDMLTRRLVTKLESLAPRLRCVNYYGATETQQALSYHPVAPGRSRRAAEALPLGRGTRDVQLLVLGRGGELAGIAEVGEIVFRSPHLARGYLDDPRLSAERFVPDPGGGGERVYLTGDLGRFRPDGEVVFLRRADQQIKLRGFRIEPAEVEAVLGRHPAVRDAAVGLAEDRSGEQVLVAWWTPRPGAEATAGELRDLSAEHLPVAMVPAAFVPLDDLPLTPTGKLDRGELRRRARPALDAQRRRPAVAAPRGPHEVRLVSLWEQVLRRNPIGVTENFFELGGHSLLAIRLFALIEQTFGQALPISTLFRAPTVEQLARVLRREGYESRWTSVVPIHPWGKRPPLFCVHGITGDPFIYRHLAQHLGADQPLYGLLARGLDQEEPPFTRMEEMAAYYLREMRQVQPHGPYFLGGFCFGGVAASEIARQLIAAGEEVALLATFDGQASVTSALPESVFRRYRRAQLRRQVKRQLDAARPLPMGEKLGYLAARAIRLASRIAAGLLRRTRRAYPSGPAEPLTDVAVANRTASRRYRPGFYPGRVAVFRSIESLGEVFLDPCLGWQVLAQGRIELYDIPGLHHSMFDEPNVQVLAAELKKCLDAAGAQVRIPGETTGEGKTTNGN